METLTQELAEYLSLPPRPGTTWDEQLGEDLGPGALREWMAAEPADDGPCWVLGLYPTGWQLTRLDLDESDAIGVLPTVLFDEMPEVEVVPLSRTLINDW
ncbi:hypothetical protein [Myxococcus eversor]|uniref:hypothetical protein n=1 Tax=Myxococcus eversor TaxID=2709661 RepID=UPI0013D4A4D6|nr:hypothetical protein [Myxococcus eversor]